MGAVTSEIRAQVVRRSGGRCEDTSGTPHCGPVEASHRNHLRDDSMREVLGLPKYNSAEACECLCLRHHLFAHEEGFGINGLSATDNKRAIGALRHKLNNYLRSIGEKPIDYKQAQIPTDADKTIEEAQEW